MQSDPESPFEMLEPPPGGVDRMRARLAEPERALHRLVTAGVGVATLSVLVALALVSNERHGPAAGDNAMLASPELDRLLGREARPPPLSVERDGQPVRTEQLPSADPQVRIYRML